jgi:phospholipid/cholesterol/gamma-HCH transport system ATP-binding protein
VGIGDDHLQRSAGQYFDGFDLQQMTEDTFSAVEPLAAEPQSAVVEFRQVTVSFDGPPVLRDISFSVGPRETRILLGPAGVGKSVLLKATDGLVRPDSGSILLFGEDIAKMQESSLFALRSRTGMVFQEGALFDSLNVRDNVAYQLIQERVPDEEIDRRVKEALLFVGLEHTFSLFPGSLSGGMRRRVAIARALIRNPELLLYDSPTGGLDPVTSTTIIELIVKQRDFYKTPSIMVTHRLQDAFTMVTHRFDSAKNAMVLLPEGETDPNTTFMMMNEGQMIFDGSIHELVASEDPFVKEFLE